MNRLFGAFVLLVSVCGCVEPSRVILEKRKVPVYPHAVRPVPANVRVAIYPASEVGDAKTRALRAEGHDVLTAAMKAEGYDVMPATYSKAGSLHR